MNKRVIPIKTNYIKPDEGYEKLINNIIMECRENDYIFISETPLSTAENNIIDESEYIVGTKAFLLTEIWSKALWGYILCPLLGCKQRTIHNLRQMPKEARNHKQYILEEYGLKHALQPTSEAGVDLSNMPLQYVSPLPINPEKTAQTIKNEIKDRTNKNVHIIIIDTDATYEFNNMKFTTLPQAIDGIKKNTGVFGYILGNFSKKLGPTILASTISCDINKLIQLAKIAEEHQVKNSKNFFETAYNMKKTFNKDYDEITADLLNSVTHIPAVIIRFE